MVLDQHNTLDEVHCVVAKYLDEQYVFTAPIPGVLHHSTSRRSRYINERRAKSNSSQSFLSSSSTRVTPHQLSPLLFIPISCEWETCHKQGRRHQESSPRTNAHLFFGRSRQQMFTSTLSHLYYVRYEVGKFLTQFDLLLASELHVRKLA